MAAGWDLCPSNEFVTRLKKHRYSLMALSLLIARTHCDGGQNAHPTKPEPAWALRTSNKDRTLVAVYPQWSEEYEEGKQWSA